MPTWKSRSPDNFPACFPQAVLQAFHPMILGLSPVAVIMAHELTIDQATQMARQFRYFRWCVREHPAHELFSIERDYALQLRTVPKAHKFALMLTVKRKVCTDTLKRALATEEHPSFA